MKTFIRENPTIALGLGLPLLLALVFFIFSAVPAMLVESPKYDVLYMSEYYNNQQLQVVVEEGEVKFYFRDGKNQYRQPRVWRFNPQTGAVKEITFMLPRLLTEEERKNAQYNELTEPVLLDIKALKRLRVDNANIAPDGYQFVTDKSYSRGVFTEIFYSSRHRNSAVLTKQGRSIRLPSTDGNYYNRNVRFIGWVLEEKPQQANTP